MHHTALHLDTLCGVSSMTDLGNLEHQEQARIRVSQEIWHAVRKLGIDRRLLLAQLNWDAIFRSAEPPGAPMPNVARSSLTRDARRKARLQRQARLVEHFAR